MNALDTSPDAEAVRLEVLRRLTPEERARWTDEMSNERFEVARNGIRLRHPEYDDDDVRLAMLRLLHGDELVRTIYPAESLRTL